MSAGDWDRFDRIGRKDLPIDYAQPTTPILDAMAGKQVDVLAWIDRQIEATEHGLPGSLTAHLHAEAKEARTAVVDAFQLLRDIRACGEWYRSALEIDTYAGHGHDGNNLPERIDALLARHGGAA